MTLPPEAANNIGNADKDALDAIFPKLEKHYPVTVTYNFLNGVAGKPAFNLEDGIHPNTKGHQKIADNILPVLTSVIKRKSSTRRTPHDDRK